MIIQNTLKHIRGIVDPKSGKKVYLLPGNNKVDAEAWEQLRPHVAELIGKTLIEVAGKVTDKDGKVTIEDKDLKDLQIAQAEDVVKKTFSLETLESWKVKETRDSVRLAIMNQIEKVNAVGAKKANDEDK